MQESSTMTNITQVAESFFEACETGKGWDGCKAHCTDDASFSCQSEVLGDVTTLAGYCDWMNGLLGILPDGNYELKSFATDESRNHVSAFAVFRGTHTGVGYLEMTGYRKPIDLGQQNQP